ncbi:hypothetical protein [Sulfoacidibacillus thermotolerans]|uniref:Peptidase M41 domain-containing protein n=1 Tax=Sulfoacidibacillus thermotolerans TaxID=1765684 RepID=A0A2U3D3H6_SULT2|nr:hypothetical protein [Sulfoacidibacillus thermotolerans]PWI55850.1 hypothetical protein BM613_13275 [Sulfoacidibacillus thermotolerans]
MLKTKSELEREIQILLGGLIAEKQEFGEHSTGAANDLERASEIAREMLSKFGMENRLVVEKEPSSDAVEVVLQRLYAQSRRCLEEHATFHAWLAQEVEKEGVLSGDVVQAKFNELLSSKNSYPAPSH